MFRRRCSSCVRAAGWVSVGGNTVLATVKWFTGLTCGSQALVADALHSTVDVIGSVVTLIMLKLSRRPPSERYPYGLGKLEDVAALVVYLILVGAGSFIVVDAIHSVATGHVTTPKAPALVAAAMSIGVNAFMFYYISCAGRQAKSPSLIALGYENKVDALSSIAALIGIGGAILGFAPLDPIAAIVVSCIIIFESFRELYGTARRLTDAGLPPAIRNEIEHAALSAPYVQGVLTIKTRRLGPASHAEIDILVDPDLSVEAARDVVASVVDRVRARVEDMDQVRVYAHPSSPSRPGQTENIRETRLVDLVATLSELRAQRQTSGSKS